MPTSPDDPLIPISYAMHFVRLAENRGVASHELLDTTGISAAMLLDPLARASQRQYARLVTRAHTLVGSRGLMDLLGKRMHLTWHGPMGFAMLCSDNLEDALGIAARYLPTRAPGFGISWQVSGEDVDIRLSHKVPDPVVSRYCVASFQAFIAHATRELLSDGIPIRIDVADKEPDWFREGFAANEVDVSFNAPADRILVPASTLHTPLKSADRSSREVAVAQCEQELRMLVTLQGVSGQVRRALECHQDGIPAQKVIADQLGLSVRTLSRRLAQEGRSYREVVDHAQCSRANMLLESTGASIEQIAEQLGYSDAANFARAFRRWNGLSPRDYRAARQIN